MWQVLDLSELSGNLAQSIWHLHSQPPLFNVLVGILVKWVPAQYAKVFQVLNLGMTLISALMIYDAVKALSESRAMGLVLALVFLLNPAVILYENLFSYTSVTIFLVSALVYSMVRYVLKGSLLAWGAVCLTLVFLVLTRSSFHLLFIVAVIFILLAFSRETRRIRFFVLAAVSFLFAMSWYVRNYYLFDTFSSSSWMGMNMARIFPPASPLGEIRPFRPLEDYEGFYVSQPQTGVAVLDNPRKASGYVNYNHRDYLVISDLFKKEVLQTLQKETLPLGRVRDAFIIFLAPATHGPFIDINLRQIGVYGAAGAFDFSGFVRYQPVRPALGSDMTRQFMQQNGFSATAAVPVGLVWLLVLLTLAIAWSTGLLTRGEKGLVLGLAFILTYGMLVGNLFEFGENNRFRLEISPVIFVLSGIALSKSLLLFQKINSSFKILK